MKSSVERPVGEEISPEAFLRYISTCPFTWWRSKPTIVLIRTGKTEFVVPATLSLTCPAVRGCRWMNVWYMPAGSSVSQGQVWTVNAAAAPAIPVFPGTVSIISEPESKAETSIIQLNVTLSLLPASWSDFFSFSSFSCLCSYRSGTVAVSMVMLLLWQTVRQACAFLDWLQMFDLFFSGYEVTYPTFAECSSTQF